MREGPSTKTLAKPSIRRNVAQPPAYADRHAVRRKESVTAEPART